MPSTPNDNLTFLTLPPEIRTQIYNTLYQNTTIHIRSRTNIKDHPCYAIDPPQSHSLLQTCRQIHAEARPILLAATTFIYASTVPISNIRKIVSTSTRRYMRRLYAVTGYQCFRFDGAAELDAWFPSLRVLTLIQPLSNALTFSEHEYEALDYAHWVDAMGWWDRRYGETMKLFEGVGFHTYIRTAVLVHYFGDNSRDFERVSVVYVDMRRRVLMREGEVARSSRMYRLFERR